MYTAFVYIQIRYTNKKHYNTMYLLVVQNFNYIDPELTNSKCLIKFQQDEWAGNRAWSLEINTHYQSINNAGRDS